MGMSFQTVDFVMYAESSIFSLWLTVLWLTTEAITVAISLQEFVC